MGRGAIVAGMNTKPDPDAKLRAAFKRLRDSEDKAKADYSRRMAQIRARRAALIRAAQARGLSVVRVADVLGLSRRAVYNALRDDDGCDATT